MGQCIVFIPGLADEEAVKFVRRCLDMLGNGGVIGELQKPGVQVYDYPPDFGSRHSRAAEEYQVLMRGK